MASDYASLRGSPSVAAAASPAFSTRTQVPRYSCYYAQADDGSATPRGCSTATAATTLDDAAAARETSYFDDGGGGRCSSVSSDGDVVVVSADLRGWRFLGEGTRAPPPPAAAAVSSQSHSHSRRSSGGSGGVLRDVSNSRSRRTAAAASKRRRPSPSHASSSAAAANSRRAASASAGASSAATPAAGACHRYTTMLDPTHTPFLKELFVRVCEGAVVGASADGGAASTFAVRLAVPLHDETAAARRISELVPSYMMSRSLYCKLLRKLVCRNDAPLHGLWAAAAAASPEEAATCFPRGEELTYAQYAACLVQAVAEVHGCDGRGFAGVNEHLAGLHGWWCGLDEEGRQEATAWVVARNGGVEAVSRSDAALRALRGADEPLTAVFLKFWHETDAAARPLRLLAARPHAGMTVASLARLLRHFGVALPAAAEEAEAEEVGEPAAVSEEADLAAMLAHYKIGVAFSMQRQVAGVGVDGSGGGGGGSDGVGFQDFLDVLATLALCRVHARRAHGGGGCAAGSREERDAQLCAELRRLLVEMKASPEVPRGELDAVLRRAGPASVPLGCRVASSSFIHPPTNRSSSSNSSVAQQRPRHHPGTAAAAAAARRRPPPATGAGSAAASSDRPPLPSRLGADSESGCFAAAAAASLSLSLSSSVHAGAGAPPGVSMSNLRCTLFRIFGHYAGHKASGRLRPSMRRAQFLTMFEDASDSPPGFAFTFRARPDGQARVTLTRAEVCRVFNAFCTLLSVAPGGGGGGGRAANREEPELLFVGFEKAVSAAAVVFSCAAADGDAAAARRPSPPPPDSFVSLLRFVRDVLPPVKRAAPGLGGLIALSDAVHSTDVDPKLLPLPPSVHKLYFACGRGGYDAFKRVRAAPLELLARMYRMSAVAGHVAASSHDAPEGVRLTEVGFLDYLIRLSAYKYGKSPAYSGVNDRLAAFVSDMMMTL